jgi:hypothetical protein
MKAQKTLDLAGWIDMFSLCKHAGMTGLIGIKLESNWNQNTLKATVSPDFRPLDFFTNQPHLGP